MRLYPLSHPASYFNIHLPVHQILSYVPCPFHLFRLLLPMVMEILRIMSLQALPTSIHTIQC